MMRRALRALACAVLAASAAAQAAPGGVSVSPVRVDLDARQRSAALTLTNTGTRSYRFQIEPMRWTQDASGEDLYTPATELLANPPLLELAPGTSRVVRVGLLGPQPQTVEAAYRLYITEIPQTQAVESTGLQILLRLGVPLYVAPAQSPRRELRWSARVDGRTLQLHAENRGTVHERRAQLRVVDAHSAAPLYASDGFRDILAGSRWRWDIPLDGPMPATLRIEANTHEGPESVVVGVPRP